MPDFDVRRLVGVADSSRCDTPCVVELRHLSKAAQSQALSENVLLSFVFSPWQTCNASPSKWMMGRVRCASALAKERPKKELYIKLFSTI
jgi:hypothetical protein